MKKYIDIIIKMFIYLLLTMCLFLSIERIFFKSQIPNILGYSYLKIISGSMEPTYEINDYILVKKTNDLGINDVIVYKENNYYVTHRLIDISNNVYTTKGDSNNASEEISKNKVVGKVVYHSKLLSVVINILCNPVILILIGLIVVLLYYSGGKNEKKKKR